MPVNLRSVRQNLDKLLTQNERSLDSALKINDQIRATSSLVSQIALPFEPRTQHVPYRYPHHLTGNLAAESQRHQRLLILDELERLRHEAESPTRDMSFADIIARHKELAWKAVGVAEHDVDPVRIQRFVETGAGKEALNLAAREAKAAHGNDVEGFRKRFNQVFDQARADQFSEWLVEQLANDGSPLALTDRELMIIMREYAEAYRFKTPDDNGVMFQRMTEFANMLVTVNGCRIPQLAVINTPAYWEKLDNAGFDQMLPSYSALTASSECRDRLPPAEVLEAILKANERQRHKDLSIHYVDPKAAEGQGVMAQLGRGELDNRPMVFDFEKQSSELFGQEEPATAKPVVVQQMHEGIPDTFIVTSANMNHLIIDTSAIEPGDHDGYLRAFKAAADRLTTRAFSHQVSTSIAKLEQKFSELDPLSPTLSEQYGEILYGMQNLAEKVPAPGTGDLIDLQNRKALLMLSLKLDAPNLRLEFTLPDNLGNRSPDDVPRYEFFTRQAGPKSQDLVFEPFQKCLATNSRNPAHSESLVVENVPHDEVSREARAVMKEHGIHEVARTTDFPGHCQFKMNEDGQARSTGHWLSKDERKELTVFTAHDLTRQQFRGERLLTNHLTDETVLSRSQQLVAMIYGASAEAHEWDEAMELFSSSGEIPLPDSDSAISISTEALANLSSVDLKTMILHKIGLAGGDEGYRETLVNQIQDSSWNTAVAIVEGFVDELDDGRPAFQAL